MQKLNVDIGVREFQIGEGVLRLNPSDPNVYQRFMEALPKVEAVEQGTLTKEGQLLADFSSYTEGQLSINFQPAEGGTDTLYQAITQFIDQLRETATQAAQAYAIGDNQQEEGGQA